MNFIILEYLAGLGKNTFLKDFLLNWILKIFKNSFNLKIGAWEICYPDVKDSGRCILMTLMWLNKQESVTLGSCIRACACACVCGPECEGESSLSEVRRELVGCQAVIFKGECSTSDRDIISINTELNALTQSAM